ncbi:DUF3343 domain-containing protein [uncultured Subdoligranulum sp.]|uniref:DUF3343 domain-containing protein n=1 Tax=uncultured Subdoligranulum sp. TaxID=512298 RepID=UPI00262F1D19|nr:DUF3343 domain-containing protein [uncultured Subdoligranulum sp.]
MKDYVATFHTHLSALLSFQALQGQGVAARMMPVPRELSSSCGTCVRYTADGDCRGLLDRDCEAVYACGPDGYTCLFTTEDP